MKEFQQDAYCLLAGCMCFIVKKFQHVLGSCTVRSKLNKFEYVEGFLYSGPNWSSLDMARRTVSLYIGSPARLTDWLTWLTTLSSSTPLAGGKIDTDVTWHKTVLLLSVPNVSFYGHRPGFLSKLIESHQVMLQVNNLTLLIEENSVRWIRNGN